MTLRHIFIATTNTGGTIQLGHVKPSQVLHITTPFNPETVQLNTISSHSLCINKRLYVSDKLLNKCVLCSSFNLVLVTCG